MKKLLIATALSFGVGALSGCTNISHPDSSSWVASTAVASVVAAALSSLFTYLLKDKEYKNDYYKKVIDKRIKAIEALESFTSLFSSFYGILNTDYVYHSFFEDNIDDDTLSRTIDNISTYSIWFDPQTAKVFGAFNKFVSVSIASFKKKDVENRRMAAVGIFRQIESHRALLEECLCNDMASLHKVEKFFKAKSQYKQ